MTIAISTFSKNHGPWWKYHPHPASVASNPNNPGERHDCRN